ncbi:MAG TPA: prepilin-type N-terminal cleavage/methylation domain-containing protein [Opitutaceae bacterium]|nr:prepilin-type N-terminal cleavage/methylation domain-containing protein [Opitutaceae bacterium]
MSRVESRQDLPPGNILPAASLRPPTAVVRPESRGFTLLEILLVLALVGLIGALLAASVTRVFSDDHAAPEDVFWQACRSAQKMASLSERETSLSFDAKEKKLVWSNGAETEEARFDPASGEVSVQFLQAQQGGSLILIAGQVVETQEVPRVMFYSDGTCTAFRVQFRVGANAWQVAIDPWTCAPILEGKK